MQSRMMHDHPALYLAARYNNWFGGCEVDVVDDSVSRMRSGLFLGHLSTT